MSHCVPSICPCELYLDICSHKFRFHYFFVVCELFLSICPYCFEVSLLVNCGPSRDHGPDIFAQHCHLCPFTHGNNGGVWQGIFQCRGAGDCIWKPVNDVRKDFKK